MKNPTTDLSKGIRDEIFIQLRRIRNGEIKIFRKTVGFKIAFLEACSPLKDPLAS